jgi:hypothetical protein
VVTGVGRGLLHARELGGGMWGNLAARHRWRIFKWGGDIMGKGTEEGVRLGTPHGGGEGGLAAQGMKRPTPAQVRWI